MSGYISLSPPMVPVVSPSLPAAVAASNIAHALTLIDAVLIRAADSRGPGRLPGHLGLNIP
jgi:hypothetical protein